MENTLLYFDNNATTPMDERVLEAMLPYFKDFYGNASSQYAYGKQAEKAVNQSRQQIAQLIEAEDDSIYFTAGATESLNLAIKGLALRPGNKKRHIITYTTEHKAVLDTCAYLESIGFAIDYLPVEKSGIIDLQLLEKSINSDTLFICAMWVNNETGVLNPVVKIGELARRYNVSFICDATQGIGKLPFSVKNCCADIVCFSGHKFHGPKGIGAIYINKNITKNKLIAPLVHGGGQENGLRSGTYNVPSIIGLKEALKIAHREMPENTEKITNIRNYFESEILKIPRSVVHGLKAPRIYNTINASLPGFDANIFLGMHKNIAASNGSACTSALIQPSHVLLAMGIDTEPAMNSLRISIGKYNTLDEAKSLFNHILNF